MVPMLLEVGPRSVRRMGDEQEGNQGEGSGWWTAIREREGQDNRGEYFPRLQRFLAPKVRRDQWRGSLTTGIAEGGGAEGGV